MKRSLLERSIFPARLVKKGPASEKLTWLMVRDLYPLANFAFNRACMRLVNSLDAGYSCFV